MIAVQRVLPDMLAEIIRRQPLSPEKVDFAWRTSVGVALARVTTATLRDDGTLVIRLTDGRWTSELNRARTILRGRLTTLLGDDVKKMVIQAPPKGEVDKAVHRPPRTAKAARPARPAIPRADARPSRARQ